MNTENCTTPQCEICMWSSFFDIFTDKICQEIHELRTTKTRLLFITANNVFVQRSIQPLSKFEPFLNLIGTFLKTPLCIVYRDFNLKSGVCSINMIYIIFLKELHKILFLSTQRCMAHRPLVKYSSYHYHRLHLLFFLSS